MVPECEALAWQLYNKQQELKAIQAEVSDIKSEFEPMMEAYCSDAKAKRVVFCSSGHTEDDGELVVRMVERTSIEWNADKLEQRVSKKVAKQVIKKRYTIDNMKGLVEYLKTCGVDPTVFKKFIRAEKTVDQEEVDRLSELGMISVRHISGCYYVKCQKPYFTLSVKKGGGTSSGE